MPERFEEFDYRLPRTMNLKASMESFNFTGFKSLSKHKFDLLEFS